MIYPEALVGLEALDLLDAVRVQVQVLQVHILSCVLDFIDRVAGVVDPFQVRRRVKVKRFPNLIPSGLELDHVLERGQVLEVDELVIGNVYVLQVPVLVNALSHYHRGNCLRLWRRGCCWRLLGSGRRGGRY